jgi:hypothetical protein
MAKISELNNELIELVKAIPDFAGRGFSIYDLEDLLRETQLQTFPLVGVSYNGSAPQGVLTSAGQPHPSAVMVEHQFLIVVGIQYQYAGQNDEKSIATDLLDEIRNAVLGFRGVNSRPWRWMGDHPEPGASIDGIVFYSSVWHTSLPAKGNFNN